MSSNCRYICSFVIVHPLSRIGCLSIAATYNCGNKDSSSEILSSASIHSRTVSSAWEWEIGHSLPLLLRYPGLSCTLGNAQLSRFAMIGYGLFPGCAVEYCNSSVFNFIDCVTFYRAAIQPCNVIGHRDFLSDS